MAQREQRLEVAYVSHQIFKPVGQIKRRKIPVVIPRKMLVLAPHPDDELISCGGVILKYRDLAEREGIELDIVAHVVKPVSHERKERFELAKKELGLSADSRILYFDIDSRYQSYVGPLTNLIRDERPDVILIPHPTDTHRSHRNTALAVLEATYHAPTRTYGEERVKERGEITLEHHDPWLPYGVYCYETPSCRFEHVSGSPHVVDISGYLERKLDLLHRVYEGDLERIGIYETWIRNVGVLRGAIALCRAGEAFIPETRYAPLRMLLV